jgi:hypothetical protein
MTVASNRRDNTFKNDNGMAAQRMCGVGVTAQRCKHAFVLSLCGRFLTARTNNITLRNSGQSPTGAYARFEPGFAIIRSNSRHGPSGEYLKFGHIPRSALGGPPAAVRTPLSARSQQGKHTGRHKTTTAAMRWIRSIALGAVAMLVMRRRRRTARVVRDDDSGTHCA